MTLYYGSEKPVEEMTHQELLAEFKKLLKAYLEQDKLYTDANTKLGNALFRENKAHEEIHFMKGSPSYEPPYKIPVVATQEEYEISYKYHKMKASHG